MGPERPCWNLNANIPPATGCTPAEDFLSHPAERNLSLNGAALTLCRYSDEPFNTNEVIFPRWSEIPSHPPTAAFAALALVAICGVMWVAWARRRRARKQPEGITA